MHAYRGRGGPSKSTPSNVTCQKCLKKDMSPSNPVLRLTNSEPRHYSYECKAPAQERPYVPRPSRTQQLQNPKLVPKLHTEVLDDLQRKKGVADEELAKREAERAKKRQLEEDDDDDGPSHRKSEPKRQRSGSSGSVSSASSRPASPPARRRAASFFSRSPSPIAPQTRRSRDASPPVRKERDRVYDRGSDGSPESVRSRGLEDRARTASHRDLSPGRETSQRIGFERESSVSTGGHGARGGRRGPRGQGRLEHSRSPTPSAQRNRSRSRSSDQGSTRRYRERNNGVTVPAVRQPAQSAQPPRERSLSPFSKRLALTQSMNTGR